MIIGRDVQSSCCACVDNRAANVELVLSALSNDILYECWYHVVVTSKCGGMELAPPCSDPHTWTRVTRPLFALVLLEEGPLSTAFSYNNLTAEFFQIL